MITSEEAQVATLRAFLSFDPAFQQLSRRLADEGHLAGYGDLVYAAFDIALRRRLGSAPTDADIVRLVASMRISLREQQIELDSLAMEDIIRSPFSGATSGQYDDRTRADIMLFVLGQLIFDEDLDDTGLEDFLVMARAMAARRRRD